MKRSWEAAEALRAAAVWGAALWLLATVPLVLAGDRLLAPLDHARGVVTVLVATAATALLLLPLWRLFARERELDPLSAALVFGVGAGGTGLALDAALLLVRRFHYPGVSAAHTPTLVTALVSAYAAVVLVPALDALVRPMAARP
jgi:hypothetical protein